MKQDAFQSAIQILTEKDSLRVWSLIVTIFGDLAQDPGDVISGPVLGDILSPVGVRPEAMRVALYRLRNEGWLETTKRGREALHHLSASGRTQSASASRRIYASAQSEDPRWHVLCYPPVLSSEEHQRAAQHSKEGYVTVAPGVYLANGILRSKAAGAFVVQGAIGDVPDWLSKTLVPSALIDAFAELSARLNAIDFDASGFKFLSQIEIATLRALIVHRWRKLVLKLPNAPDALFGKDFAGTTCRAAVMQALDALARPELSSLARRAL